MSAATTILSVENYCRDVGGGCRGPTGSRPRRGCGLYASWGTRAEARAIELAPILRDLKLYRTRFFGQKSELDSLLHTDLLPGESCLARTA